MEKPCGPCQVSYPMLSSQVLENERQSCGSQLWIQADISKGALKYSNAHEILL